MSIKIRHLKNPRRGTELTYATIPIEEAKKINGPSVREYLLRYYPKADFNWLAEGISNFSSGQEKESGEVIVDVMPPSKHEFETGDYLKLKKVGDRVILTPAPALHDIMHGKKFEAVLNALRRGFKSESHVENAHIKRKSRQNFTGWGRVSEEQDITRGDIYNLQLFSDEGKAKGGYSYVVYKANPERILAVNIKIDPSASEERKEEKMEFYRTQITGEYGIPVRFFQGFKEETNPKRIFPKRQVLEQKVSSIVAIGGFLGSLFFLSSGFSNSNIQLSPEMLSPSGINWNLWIGLVLLLIGIIGAVFWFKKRK